VGRVGRCASAGLLGLSTGVSQVGLLTSQLPSRSSNPATRWPVAKVGIGARCLWHAATTPFPPRSAPTGTSLVPRFTGVFGRDNCLEYRQRKGPSSTRQSNSRQNVLAHDHSRPRRRSSANRIALLKPIGLPVSPVPLEHRSTPSLSSPPEISRQATARTHLQWSQALTVRLSHPPHLSGHPGAPKVSGKIWTE